MMRTLPGQLLSFCSKTFVAKYQSRVDVMAEFRHFIVAQVIGEQLAIGRLS
jgi:hypothetical protein